MNCNVIYMGPVKERLKNLREHLPEQDESIYVFGEYLAGMLSERELPEGFNMAAEISISQLSKGYNWFTGKPVSPCLAGCPPMDFISMRSKIPDITDVVCPADFAKAAKEQRESTEWATMSRGFYN
jgi:hypothetical protein